MAEPLHPRPRRGTDDPGARHGAGGRVGASPVIGAIVFGSAVISLTLHAAACAAGAVLLPRGFALDDPRAWSNTYLPGAVAIVVLAVLLRFVLIRSSGRLVALVSAAIAGGWLGAVVAGRLLFPTSLDMERLIGPTAIALALATLAWATRLRLVEPWRGREGALRSVAPTVVAAVLGAAFGSFEVAGQRAPTPSTRPLGGALADVAGEPTKDDASTGQVTFPCGKQHIRIRPLLTFESRSPDATWTMLAPSDAFGPRREFSGFSKEKAGFRARYTDDGESTLVAARDAKGLTLEAVSLLPRPVYSHLNAFSTIHVPFEASISLGASGQEPLVVDESADERSALRFAYLGPDMRLHAVRAREEARGPYEELASVPLTRGDALAIELRPKDGAGACRLTFKDWAAQASTERSPSAGWGVPQNSVRLVARPQELLIVLSLAETSPGGGSRSVGHAAGTYKNRVRIDMTTGERAAPPAKRRPRRPGGPRPN